MIFKVTEGGGDEQRMMAVRAEDLEKAPDEERGSHSECASPLRFGRARGSPFLAMIQATTNSVGLVASSRLDIRLSSEAKASPCLRAR